MGRLRPGIVWQIFLSGVGRHVVNIGAIRHSLQLLLILRRKNAPEHLVRIDRRKEIATLSRSHILWAHKANLSNLLKFRVNLNRLVNLFVSCCLLRFPRKWRSIVRVTG